MKLYENPESSAFKNYDISYEELKNKEWKNELQSQQSMYNGFWVKLTIKNESSTSEMGLHHNLLAVPGFSKGILCVHMIYFRSISWTPL